MREWTLGFGDPLSLTLAADARLSSPDYSNDHIWELELAGGEPAALALRTTYGLRARSMRLFPTFHENGKMATDPASFAIPPLVTVFYANFLALRFFPFEDIEVTAEYWVPDSHSVSGRLTIINRTSTEREVDLDWCGKLSPLSGKNFFATKMQAVNVLVGSTGGLEPVVFLTGGPAAGIGPQPSLSLKLELGPGARRQFTWAEAAFEEAAASFDAARQAAARPWDAERARIELTNASQTIDIQTGDAHWDAVFALSQQNALRLFMGASESLPKPSFVSARQPDHGFSPKGDGSDHQPVWSGQSPMEASYLAGLLPGAQELGKGLLRNFLAVQSDDGAIDHRPGLAGQRGKLLAAPLLASLGWELYQNNPDDEFLVEIYPALLKFFEIWFNPENDRNYDGIPEWGHPMQTGFEEHPLFGGWHNWSRGLDISTVHSPALMAMLYREAKSLMEMAEILGNRTDTTTLKNQADLLMKRTQKCWDTRLAGFRYRDRDSGLTQRGKILASQRGSGTIKLKESFAKPVRLLVEVASKNHTSLRPIVIISGYVTKIGDGETLGQLDFQLRNDGAVATSHKVYERISSVIVEGVEEQDKVTIRTVDLTLEDQSHLLPLWAEMMNAQQAQALIGRTLLNAERFDRPFGIPACPSIPHKDAEAICQSVHLPWNQWVLEGLLAYGFRSDATRLFVHLMAGVQQNLKHNHAFYQSYNAEIGTGIGERNAVTGLAPVGLFLKLLGVQIYSDTRIRLEGQNPFPWTVTVKFRGLSVTRHADQSEVIFPNGEKITVADELPCIISM